MGIGKITEARETAGGTVQAGGRTILPKDAAAGFDPLKANVDPFRERERQIESLRPIADAIGRQELATTGIENASATRADIDEIRNGNPNGDGNGGHVGMWRDKGGVWRKALNSDQLSADERAMVTRLAREELRHRRDERLRGETNDVRAFVNRETGEDIAAFEGDCDEALLVGRIGENFARAETSVAADAGAMNSTALGRIGSDNALLKTFNAASGGDFDAGAAARQRTDLWARQYVRKSLEGRMKAAVVLASQSGGLMSPAKAIERANAIYDGQASELMRRLVEAGEYDRARTFVGHAEELGYSGAVKAKALGDIDAAEINAATANGLKAYNTAWNENGERVQGRDKILDAQIATLKRVAENALKGSRAAISALGQAKRFEEAADELAYEDLLDGISNGWYFEAVDPKKGGAPKLVKQPFEKGTRAARLWPKAVEAYEKKILASRAVARKTADLEEKDNVAVAIANLDPQSYFKWLSDKCREGVYSIDERRARIASFRKIWFTGFKDGNDPSAQSRLIADMASIIDNTFGVKFSESLAKDKSGHYAVDAYTGKSVASEGATLPDIGYQRVISADEIKKPWYSKIADFQSPSSKPGSMSASLSGEDMKEIMDAFLFAWAYNGSVVKKGDLELHKLGFLYDEADDKDDTKHGRPSGCHRIDAIMDFKRFCEELNKGKRALDAYRKRSDPTMLDAAEKSNWTPREAKTLGTRKNPYVGWGVQDPFVIRATVE